MLVIKNTANKMKNVSDGLISRLDTDEERISNLKDLSIESRKAKKEREPRPKNSEQNIQRLWDNYKRC